MSSEMVSSSCASIPAVAESRRRLPDLSRHLEPERLLKSYGQAINRSSMAWMGTEHLYRSPSQRERLTRELTECLPTSELASIGDALCTALESQPSRKVVQASVAILFDSRVRGPQNPEIYLEALVYDLVDEGFPPAVVVGACQKLRREQTFTPEISEVIAACREKLKSYRAVQRLALILVEERTRVEEILREIEAAPPPKPRKPFDPNDQPGDPGWD